MLPKIDVPIYTVKLLSNGEIVKFRPFTVKEEKLFLMANEADDVNSAIDTIKQVMNNCVLTELNIDKLPIYDFEYLFLNIQNDKINLYKNIFAIKRSGDYLQIDYCKKNNYIFVTTDAMSASFCFIDNCEFIGPFGPYGLFIKKQENSEKYCHDNDKYNLLYNK